MIKMLALTVKDEEIAYFEKYKDTYGIALTMREEPGSMDRMNLAEGMDCINVLSDVVITEEMWDAYKKAGIKLGITRTIGMEHMNAAYANQLGIAIRNITYSPASVADYAIMMMLMVLRNVKSLMLRYAGQDYTMPGHLGRELPNMTVGIIGAGPIALTLARHIQGFGCQVTYWNRSRKSEMDHYAQYLPLEKLLSESDIVTLHIASNEETYHFMDSEKIEKMKKGAILINTARGPLVDNEALITALEKKHLYGAGLDVIDGDRPIYYRDHKNEVIRHREMAVLQSMPNVLCLPHAAYFTDQAVEDMVRNSLVEARNFFKK